MVMRKEADKMKMMKNKRKTGRLLTAVLLATIIIISTFVTKLSADDQTEDDGTVYDYSILSVTQTGSNEITVKLQARYCPYCNPNYASNSGCPEFTHGYPPPYYPYQYWCSGIIDGRYIAVRIKNETGAILGTQKLVCNPINWPLNSIVTTDFIFNGILTTSGDIITAEADVYCSWCGHWYPEPKSLEISPLKICIDPGHAPTDEFPKNLEYAINKGVADKLKSKLETKGYYAGLTEPVDTRSRASWVNNVFKPHIFISLHCNALQGFDEEGKPIGTANGSEVWFYNDTDSGEEAMHEHDLAVRTLKNLTKEIGSEARLPIPKEKENPWDGKTHKCYNEDGGYWLGIPILNGNCTACGWRFGVTACPAVLIEMEFFDYSGNVTYKGITYPNMLELMETDIWQEDVAKGIADGIIGYFEWRGLTYIAKSPVDIVITDPDGLTISKQFNEIPGATYTEIDIDGDGYLDDQIRIPDRKIGNYIIEVIPEPGASPTDTYTLEVILFGIPIIVAENIPICNIPSEPYIIESTETGVTLPTIQSIVDIDPDTLNLNSNGKWITCYIELPDGYDVVDINISTILLNNTVPAENKPTNISDYDNDGILDLMVKFDRQAVQDILELGENVLTTVTGKLFDETQFEGIDYIRVI